MERLRRWWWNASLAWEWRKLWTAAAILAVLALFAAQGARYPRNVMEACERRYAAARTAVDTARVDGWVATRRGRWWHCGSFRRSDAPTPDAHDSSAAR